MQCEVLRPMNLHHMVYAAVAQGVGEGRSAFLCMWLAAAAEQQSAPGRLYNSAHLGFRRCICSSIRDVCSRMRAQEVYTSTWSEAIVRFCRWT